MGNEWEVPGKGVQAKSACKVKGRLGKMQVTGTVLLGWPKSLFSFFCKIKDTFFIFTNNFVDLDILSKSAICHYWLLVGRGQGGC